MVEDEYMMKSTLHIELKDLTKVYGSGETGIKALDKVNLHVVKGEIILIMGPSGSGKTTLIQIIGALLKPTSGEIIINGMSIAKLSDKELSVMRLKTFGFIFQSSNLFSSLSAVKNVELVLNIGGIKGEKARQMAKNRLDQLSLGHRLSHRPNKLSGGEHQRVAIARALVNNPQIILADEPTANLDSKTGYAVVELLRKVAKEEEKTVIIVSHDTRITNLADRILWLEDGQLSLKWSKGIIIDPVCLMSLDAEDNHINVEHQEKVYYFCSEKCKKEFENNTEKYITGPKP